MRSTSELKRRDLLGLAALASVGALVDSAHAQDVSNFPYRPVRLIVTSQAGNVTDVNARVLGARLSTLWKQPVVVEQKVGANGAIGTSFVTQAEPDGHTLLVTTTALVQTLALRGSLPYNLFEDLAPISQVFFLRLGLVVDAKLGVQSLRDFIELARKEPGKYSFGSFGIGSTAHMVVGKLNTDLGLNILHVPYRGTPAALQGLLTGEVQAALLDPFIAQPHVDSGKLRMLATTGKKRSVYLPGTPTFEESGVKGFDVDNWCGWFAPGKTPPAVLGKISRDIQWAQGSPEVVAAYQNSGIEIAHSTPDEYRKIVRRDADYWTTLVKNAGIKPE